MEFGGFGGVLKYEGRDRRDEIRGTRYVVRDTNYEVIEVSVEIVWELGVSITRSREF
jgi:hypothetical protein